MPIYFLLFTFYFLLFTIKYAAASAEPFPLPQAGFQKEGFWVFDFSYFVNRIRGRFQQTASRRNIFKLNWIRRKNFISYSAVRFRIAPLK